MNSTTLHSTSQSFNTKVCPHVRQVILEDFRLQFLQPYIIHRSYAFYMPFYPTGDNLYQICSTPS